MENPVASPRCDRMLAPVAGHPCGYRRSVRRLLLSMIALLGMSGCNDCDHFESRGVDFRVQLSPPGAEIEQWAGFSVQEIASLDFKSVRFSVSGSNLRWHVRGFRLLESTGEKRVLFDILLETPGPDPNSAAYGQATGDELQVGTWEQFLVLLETHGVAMELVTDVPGMEQLLFPVNVENATEWIRSPCPTD